MNRNTIQLMPEDVDGFSNLTKNISAISIAICVGRIGKLGILSGWHISVFVLRCSAVHSLTDTPHIVVSHL